MKIFQHLRRRTFIRRAGGTLAVLGVAGTSILKGCQSRTESIEDSDNESRDDRWLGISLAQWSHHRALHSGTMDHLDFAAVTRSYGIGAVEYVNQFFAGKAEDTEYLEEMSRRAADHDVRQLLIMIDGEGALATTGDALRTQAVENHYKWVTAARHLSCHSIRVNLFGEGPADDMHIAAVDGLGRLAEFGREHAINVIVENHGGLSSNGAWLAGVIAEIDMPNCGTLPDFGNFCIRRESGAPWGAPCIEEYDKYRGVAELMPFAKAVSAKSFDFDDDGNESTIDFARMIDIVIDAGYSGYIGIEYEGSRLSEQEGILATRALLERLIQQSEVPLQPAQKE